MTDLNEFHDGDTITLLNPVPDYPGVWRVNLNGVITRVFISSVEEPEQQIKYTKKGSNTQGVKKNFNFFSLFIPHRLIFLLN